MLLKGPIVGFGNFLFGFYESKQPRAVVVGWDTLDAPTHRQKLFAGYQVGRSFDNQLIEQLSLQPIRAREMARIGPADVRKRYGVDPRQVPGFIALRGDPSRSPPRTCYGSIARSNRPYCPAVWASRA